MFVSTRVWGCGDSGISCYDGYECHSPNEGESCPDGGQECCFDHSQDEESKAGIVLAIVLPILAASVCIAGYVYRRKYQCAKDSVPTHSGFCEI